MSPPLVTVLIDTYNHGRLLDEAIESVLAQDFPAERFEIVIVDDGSTDGTEERVKKYGSRVRYLRKPNGGQASAFNAAFPELRGEIISLLDGDDWWVKRKLTVVVDDLERNPEASAVSHTYWKIYENTREARLCGPPETTLLNLATPEAARAAARGWGFLQPSALTVRRRVLERVMPIPEVLVFSADSPIALASMAMGVRVLAQPLSYYRIHSANLYASESSNETKLRRRYEMDDVMFSVLSPMLLRLGVPSESVSAFIDPAWTAVNRACLSMFGGSRLKTFRTEMRAFHSEFREPSMAYRLFKYAVVGTATLLLSPQRFYKGRDWYARRRLAQLRDGVSKADASPGGASSSRPVD